MEQPAALNDTGPDADLDEDVADPSDAAAGPSDKPRSQKPKSRKARQKIARERAAAAAEDGAEVRASLAAPVFLPSHAPAISALKSVLTVSGADAGITFEPIGFIESVFPQKHGTPRQPSLVPLTRARLKIRHDISPLYCLEGLEEYSHVWIQFVFHLNENRRLQTKIALPRLDGGKVGVFASRSPHHPNPLGLSVVRLEAVDRRSGTLHLSAVDLVDGTPVLDVKPYLPYSDSIPDARVAKWMEAPRVAPVGVRWTGAAEGQLRALVPRMKFYARFDEAREAVQQCLALDPRSTHSRGKDGVGGVYGMAFDRLNVVFRAVGEGPRELFEVFEIEYWGDTRPTAPDGKKRDHHPRGPGGPAAEGDPPPPPPP